MGILTTDAAGAARAFSTVSSEIKCGLAYYNLSRFGREPSAHGTGLVVSDWASSWLHRCLVHLRKKESQVCLGKR